MSDELASHPPLISLDFVETHTKWISTKSPLASSAIKDKHNNSLSLGAHSVEMDDELDALFRELAGSGLDATSPSIRHDALERIHELLQDDGVRKQLAETWNGKGG